jgi:hypothetical protein
MAGVKEKGLLQKNIYTECIYYLTRHESAEGIISRHVAMSLVSG